MKMKSQTNIIYITILCVVFCFCWSTQDKINVRIPPQLVLEFRQQAEKCEKETGIPAALKKIIDKTLPKDTPNNQFFRCVTLNTGYTDNDGRFNIDGMAKLEVDGNVDDYKKVITECNKVEKGDPLETLLVTSDCIHGIYHFVPVVPK